jgi:CRP/FNR family transcriptional regulator, cyclic AMP receptor protein
VQDQETPDVLGEALRREGRPRQFAAGQALFVEGDSAERVFVLESGWVLLSCAAADGREVVLGLRGPGDVIGDMSILDGEPRSATALALAPIEAMVAPASALTAALSDPAVAQAMIRVLAARLRDADRKRVEFSSLDTLGRVAWRLLELSERFGSATDGGIVVELPLSQEQLASWCGASREATVKALASLRSLGTITTGRRRVVITSADALSRHARGLARI